MRRCLGSDDTSSKPGHVIFGSSDNFWFWSAHRGWDLTHPASRDAEPFASGMLLECDISNVTIDPGKTALLIIDMQNYSVSKSLYGDVPTQYTHAEDTITQFAIPAARKAGIQIIWLNWGLTEDDVSSLPPNVMRVFGWAPNSDENQGATVYGDDHFSNVGESPRRGGLGTDMGEVTLDDGVKIQAGRALMRDTWNAAIHDPLMPIFEEGQKASRPDVLVHKDRNSGLWNDHSALHEYLKREGIRTLLFTGMNTDQCVISTLLDAQARCFDTIFLRDGCATNSPDYAQQSAEYNCRRPLGFLSSCKALAQAVSDR